MRFTASLTGKCKLDIFVMIVSLKALVEIAYDIYDIEKFTA